MLDAEWEHTSTESDQSWEYGNSLFWTLERGGLVVELEYYEHGQLVAYPVTEEPDDVENAEPYFSIMESTIGSSRAAMAAQGWL